MDGPGGYYANRNKPDREKQIPYDFAYMWNLKSKQTNKQSKTETDSEIQRTNCWLPEWRGHGGMSEIGEGE